MQSHEVLKEKAEIIREDEPMIEKKHKKCNMWLLFSIVELIVVIVLVLAICGVFENLSNSESFSDPNGTEIEGEAEEFDTNSLPWPYLTGDVAPNIVFLIADDIGWSDISHNDGEFSTPNIDKILEDGIELTRFYSHALCTPSRMAFLTGRLAWKLGSQFPEVIHGMMVGHIPPEEKTYAEVTKEMGYDNYYVGRWGVGYASWDMTPLGRGWDKFMGYFGPEGGYYNHSTSHFSEWFDVYDMWDMKEPYISANMTYSEDLFLDRSLKYLEQAKLAGKPFTLTYASQTAHAPIDDDWPTFYPPNIWTECEQTDSTLIGREYYCNKVKYLDYNWGVLIDYLRDSGLWDNTVIFLTTDNGALPYAVEGPWSDWGCNWPLRSGKVTHFEGGIKVWAGISGGLVPQEFRGTTFDELTHIVDFATTAMRLSMNRSEYEGRSTLTGTEKIVDGINLFNFEHHDLLIHNVLTQYTPSWVHFQDSNYAATDGEWKFYHGFNESSVLGTGWYGFPGKEVITGDSNPTVFEDAGGYCDTGCLFHLTSDPSEYYDISEDYPEIVAYYLDVLNAIYVGGLDEDYHSGQPYEEDYRGYQADNILRPYLSEEAITDYLNRTETTDYNFTYDYSSFTLSWIGDYDGRNSPFDA